MNNEPASRSITIEILFLTSASAQLDRVLVPVMRNIKSKADKPFIRILYHLQQPLLYCSPIYAFFHIVNLR